MRSEKVIVMKLNAGNDRDGNPRRVFVVFDSGNGQLVDTIDEGHHGNSKLNRKFPNHLDLGTFLTTTSEYKSLLKEKKGE